MKYLKIPAILLAVLLILFGIFLLFATLTEYRPDPAETVSANSTVPALPNSASFNILTWNIGYCGLDAGMDFFYDGGTRTRTTKEQTLENLREVCSFLTRNDSADFILLQEVDKYATRSHFLHESDTITARLGNYQASAADNYRVRFVPVPLTDPMGTVDSGILTLGKPIASSVTRYAYPGSFAWPKSLMMLKRCFLVNRYPLSNHKELLVINTHNSAFDHDGFLKKQELSCLKQFLEAEYARGNYIVAGGDWNQSPFGLTPGIQPYDRVNGAFPEANFMPPEWKYLYCSAIPSNRSVKTAFREGTTPVSVIDYFLVSPNIRSAGIRTVDLKFKNSDHQPVVVKIRLLP